MADKNSEKPKKKAGLGRKLGVVFAGLFVGCGGAVGIQYAVGAMVPAALAAEQAAAPKAVEYVEVGKLMVPVVDHEGDLVSYLRVEATLEVPEGSGEDVRSKLPIVMHEVNMRTWKTALSQGADGRLVDTNGLEKIFSAAAREVYGKEIGVKRVLLTSTIPA